MVRKYGRNTALYNVTEIVQKTEAIYKQEKMQYLILFLNEMKKGKVRDENYAKKCGNLHIRECNI